jgi:hypothetical protein
MFTLTVAYVIIQFYNNCIALFMFIINLSKNLKIKIYKTTILPFLLHDFEAWSVILREE